MATANSYGNITARVIYHSIFWMLLYAILLLFDTSGLPFRERVVNEFIHLLFFIAVVYFNMYYLIPKFLRGKQPGIYLLLMMASALVITPLRLLVFYFRFEEQPELQQALLERMHLYFLSTFIVLAISTLGSIVVDWFRQLRVKQELENQTIQSELRFLKSQINPHFLFNTLNSLYALTLKKSDQAPEVVIKLSEMLRYMLYECNEKLVPLEKEINYLRNYLDLEALRQRTNVEIKFDIEGEVKSQQIAPLLLIPFLENSFKHGVNTQIEHSYVHILIKVEASEITFQIVNSKGRRLPNPENRPSGGIGLTNVRRRLNLIYPEAYQLHTNDEPNKYAVNLAIKLDKG